MELSDNQIHILNDMIDLVADKARHYKDAELGWDEEDLEDFYELSGMVNLEAKRRGFWWAR